MTKDKIKTIAEMIENYIRDEISVVDTGDYGVTWKGVISRGTSYIENDIRVEVTKYGQTISFEYVERNSGPNDKPIHVAGTSLAFKVELLKAWKRLKQELNDWVEVKTKEASERKKAADEAEQQLCDQIPDDFTV